MATIMRVKLNWTGFIGAPGYTVFHFRDFALPDTDVADAQDAVNKVDAFANGFRSYCPSVVTLKTAADVEIIEETNGALVDVLTTVPAAAMIGNQPAANTYAAAVGGVVTWRTAGIRNNRRIRGRSFLVPFGQAAFAADGTLAASTVSGLNTLATDLRTVVGSAILGVWARPTAIKDANGVPTGAYNNDGILHQVTSHSVPDMGAVLRSRRD